MSDGQAQFGDVRPGRSVTPAFALKAVLATCGAFALVVIGIGIATHGGNQSSAVVNATLSQWKVEADPAVAAGEVTFRVTNEGTIVHEMLVLKTDTPAKKLPITNAGDPPVPVTTGADKIDEGPSIGETGNVKPGATRTFTLKNMKPGHYVLLCNIANHYSNGMRTTLTITP